jgi:thiol-disulfide isomerase/thioredoxin
MTRAAVLLAVVAATLALGTLWRARNGRVRPAQRPAQRPAPSPAAGLLGLLGHEPGPPTLVQFTGPECSQCDQASEVLEEVAGQVGGVRVLTVDAADRLDVAEAVGVWRVPTVLVVDGTGAVTARAGGVPRHRELLDALRGAGRTSLAG